MLQREAEALLLIQYGITAVQYPDRIPCKLIVSPRIQTPSSSMMAQHLLPHAETQLVYSLLSECRIAPQPTAVRA